MVITTTAVGFILLGVGLGVCGWFFLRAFWKSEESRKNSKLGFVLSVFILASALQNAVLGFGSLLFAPDPEGLYSILLASQILLAVHALLGVYTVYYIFFPRRTPLPALMLAGAVGLTTLFITIREHPPGSITRQSSVYWPASFPLSLLTFLMLLISIGSFFYIFARLFRETRARNTRVLALLLSLLALGGIVSVFFRFVGAYASAEHGALLDISMGIIGFIFLVSLIWIPLFKRRVVAGGGVIETHK